MVPWSQLFDDKLCAGLSFSHVDDQSDSGGGDKDGCEIATEGAPIRSPSLMHVVREFLEAVVHRAIGEHAEVSSATPPTHTIISELHSLRQRVRHLLDEAHVAVKTSSTKHTEPPSEHAQPSEIRRWKEFYRRHWSVVSKKSERDVQTNVSKTVLISEAISTVSRAQPTTEPSLQKGNDVSIPKAKRKRREHAIEVVERSAALSETAADESTPLRKRKTSASPNKRVLRSAAPRRNTKQCKAVIPQKPRSTSLSQKRKDASKSPPTNSDTTASSKKQSTPVLSKSAPKKKRVPKKQTTRSTRIRSGGVSTSIRLRGRTNSSKKTTSK